MRRLYSDMMKHPISAGAFLAYYVAVWVLTFLTWSRGMSNLAVFLHVAAPVISGAVVSWWRFPLREGLLHGGWRLTGPPLSGVLVAALTVSIVFVGDAARAVTAGNWRSARVGEFVLSWLAATAILSAIGSVLALFGAVLSASLAQRFKK